MDDVVQTLDTLIRAGRFDEVEAVSRQLLAQRRFYLWHLYLIVSLLRTGRRGMAERELDVLFSYKFNIEDRAWPEIKEAFPDRFGQHFILSMMKPEASVEAGAPIRKRWTVPFPIGERAAFEAAGDEMLADCVASMPPLDRAATRVTTFGSCFAANLARLLKASGVDASNLLIEESVNSPLANQAFLRAVVEPETSEHRIRLEATFGADFLGRARAQLAAAQIIVLTLGVAPSFFHGGSHRFAFLEDYRSLLAQGLLYMRTPSVEEAKSVISDVVELLRVINGDARLYVSISPVPLMGTAEFSNAVMADCISKTTLRAALHEVLQGSPPNVHYWPSFEIVRWLGAHSTLPVYGAGDGNSRHVSDWVVELIVDRFGRHLFGADARQRGANSG